MSISIKISVSMDRQAALLAGRLVGENETIEVTQDGMGEHWGEMVKELDMSVDPPVLNGIALSDSTEAAVRGVFTGRVAKRAAKIQEESDRLDKFERSLDAREAALVAPLLPVEMHAQLDLSGYGPGPGEFGFVGVKRELPCETTFPGTTYNYGVYYCLTDEHTARRDALRERARQITDRNNAEIDAADRAAFEAALPGLREKKAALDTTEAQAKAEEKTARLAALQVKLDARKASGYWEKETSSYNERRYGAWWCASVDFSSGANPNYTWGESTGKWGNAGLLRVPCKPGDIIAYGQKDNRNPSKSDHYLLLMGDDYRMTSVDKTEAFRHWKKTYQAA